MASEHRLLLLCRNLRELRAAHGLTKTEMARILGIGIKTLNSLEQNIVPPRLGSSVLIRASQYFHTTTDDLFRARDNYHI